MIHRTLEKKLNELTSYYPVVIVTGPRQSGKTTLCRMAYPNRRYVSLEALDTRDYARNDPRGFLAEYSHDVIIDEVQHVPELLNYLQSDVDGHPDPGRFILTGSQHFGLSESVSQSLAGRCGILVLLPPSLEELRRFPNSPSDLFSLLWKGSYPRIYDQNIPAHQWLADYTSTYIQRDVRQVINVTDLQSFSGFLKLCAGRTGQELNFSTLGNDAGVSHNTVRAWISVLETSYIIHRLPAWHANIRKQVVKTPKLHFLDSGLVCYLLGIREPDQLRLHPLRGAIFESWIVSEIYKARAHSGMEPNLFHYREARGPEIDLLMEHGRQLAAVEIKSGTTINEDFFKNLKRFSDRMKDAGQKRRIQSYIVYGGDTSQKRTTAHVLPWHEVRKVIV
ncbi:MAG: ATP-binding protein [Deltaproteobacteria bacterium]|nr:ATP-binding protein [Deltaproteobacteria bacterium]MBN2688155.1 ATP-binding protein [Deltaproteobacteria bacterium]